jgi:hypothetical protein
LSYTISARADPSSAVRAYSILHHGYLVGISD